MKQILEWIKLLWSLIFGICGFAAFIFTVVLLVQVSWTLTKQLVRFFTGA